MLKETYIQINTMLDLIDDTLECIKDFGEREFESLMGELAEELRCTIEIVNMELLGSSKVCFFELEKLKKEEMRFEHKDELVRQLVYWKEKAEEIVERRYNAVNVWDESFIRLMDYIQCVDFDQIVQDTKDSLYKHNDEEIKDLCTYYQRFHVFWGTLDVKDGRYDVIINRVTALKEHREDFIWLYGRLGDWRSKLVLVNMLYNWITFDISHIASMKEGNYSDYFDLDLVKCDENEVLVDLGAWEGDSALDFIQTYGKYKKIYCYEIDVSSVEAMKKNLSGYPDIEYRNKGVGNKNGKGYMYLDPFASTCDKITDETTGNEIEIVRLDDDIEEKVSLIKMDIEGAEREALAGCVRHIQEDKPNLLISVYHNNEDIWKIPQMILDMRPDYQIYLRSNGAQWGPSEIVLIAVD